MDCFAPFHSRLVISAVPKRAILCVGSSAPYSLVFSSRPRLQEIIADVFSNAIESLSEDDRKLPQVTFAALVLRTPVTHVYALKHNTQYHALVYRKREQLCSVAHVHAR